MIFLLLSFGASFLRGVRRLLLNSVQSTMVGLDWTSRKHSMVSGLFVIILEV